MTLDEFLKKQSVNLSTKAYDLCLLGLEEMKKGQDGMHDDIHIFGILDSLDAFLLKGEVIKDEIDFDILLLSIFWHDVWKSRRKPTNFLNTLFHAIYEGKGSKKIFIGVAKENQLDPKIIKEVAYAISMHNFLGKSLFFKIKTLEAKILADVDALDSLRPDKIKSAEDKYLHYRNNVITRTSFHIGYWMYKRIVEPETFHFEINKQFARKEMKKRMEEIDLRWDNFLKK